MPNVDEQGNKIAAKVEKKSIVSKRIRERRAARNKQAERPNKNICDGCGYKIRSKNHVKGKHHNGQV